MKRFTIALAIVAALAAPVAAFAYPETNTPAETGFASNHGGITDAYSGQITYGDGNISFREGGTTYFSNGTQAPTR